MPVLASVALQAVHPPVVGLEQASVFDDIAHMEIAG